MPHATHAYPFEAKVGAFGGDLCRRFTAGGALRAFVLVLDDAGSVQALTFADGSPQWRERVQALETAGTPHLFHDPLDDGREYVWLSWHRLERATMERLLGRAFEDAD